MFIVFEGIDGVGKSTLMNEVAIALSNKVNQDVCLTRFPKRHSDPNHDPRKLLFSKQYARAAVVNYEQMIQYSSEIANTKDIIICDRWVYSSWAYQWRMGSVYLGNAAFEHLALFIDHPDLLVYCHAPLPICRYRVISRDGLHSADLGLLTEHNYKELRAGYNIALSTKIGGKCPKKVLSLDTSGNIEDLVTKVLAEIEALS